MRRLMQQLRRYGWNKRPFTEDDFYHFCKQENVIVQRDTRGWSGEYFIYRGHPIILLHPMLQSYTFLWVAFHELTHHWLHVPESQFFYGTQTKIDLQADSIATPAIIPKHWLQEPGLFRLFEEGYPPALLETRKAIFDRYRI